MKFAYLMLVAAVSAAEPNPPTWCDNVKVIQPGQSDAQSIVNAIWTENGGNVPSDNGQWSQHRYAIMFEPGTHDVEVNVGYYTQVMGLGRKPTDTNVKDLWSPNGDFSVEIGALNNFWRSVENFYVTPQQGMGSVIWAVSQAAPMRRMHIQGDLWLFQVNFPNQAAGYASGGFAADNYVDGSVNMGSQQQFFTRNMGYDRSQYGAWSFVHVGDPNSPDAQCGNADGATPSTPIDATPVIREKPYIIMDDQDAGTYKLMHPNVETNKVSNTQNWENAEEIDFSNVYVASETDTAAEINAKLDEGLHLVLQPGQYHLEDSIKVNNPNTVVLGLGLATLISSNGNACIEVGDVDGVAIAGILFQAGTTYTETLLKVGTGANAGDPSNPISLSDIFARVGGPNNSTITEVSCGSMAVVNTGYVIIDNTWFWRADHDVAGQVTDHRNPVDNGIIINGDHVTAYGLASEHTLGDLVYWTGNYGETYFYQSELPYDADESFVTNGYAGYHVADNVTNHKAYGVGVYSYFRDNDVTVESGIRAPEVEGVTFTDSLSVHLNGLGGIKHVINQQGDATSPDNQLSYVCSSTNASLFLQ